MATSSQLPSAQIVQLTSQVALLPPLSRIGRGPGLILIRPSCFSECQQHNSSLDPEPIQKWAEESFTVAHVTLDAQSSIASASIRELVQKAKDGLAARSEYESQGQLAMIGWHGT